MAGPSLVPQAPAHQMCSEWPCQGPARQGSSPSRWLLFPLESAPEPGPFPAGLVLCQPSPASAGAVGFSCPGPDEVWFGPILGFVCVCLCLCNAAIPCGSLLFPSPLHFLIPCQFAEGVLCPSFLGAGECLGLWDGPWSPARPRCSRVFSCWLQLCDPEIWPVFQASFPSVLGALGTSDSS